MIQDHFLPIAKKLRENAMIVEQKEKQMTLWKHSQQMEDSDFEADVQEVKETYSYWHIFAVFTDSLLFCEELILKDGLDQNLDFCGFAHLKSDFNIGLLLTLNAPIATKVVCFSRLLKCLRSLYGKQCGPRSDC